MRLSRPKVTVSSAITLVSKRAPTTLPRSSAGQPRDPGSVLQPCPSGAGSGEWVLVCSTWGGCGEDPGS